MVQDKWLKLRIIEREKEMQAFMIYHKEIGEIGIPTQSNGGEKNSKRAMESTKAQWDALTSQERRDFTMRVEADQSVINYLKTDAPQGLDYLPVNYYAHFLKDQLTQANESHQSIKINKKYISSLYHEVWL